MRKKRELDMLRQSFIHAATVNSSERLAEIKRLTSSDKWEWDPSLKDEIDFEEGSHLKKNITLILTESEWNTVDVHVKKLSVSKAEWLRYAVYRILAEEQKKYG